MRGAINGGYIDYNQKSGFKISAGFVLGLALFYFLDGSGIFSCVIIASVVHELGHLAAMALSCVRASGIRLELTGAAITYDNSRVTYFTDAFIAAMGPLFGIGLSVLASLLAGYDDGFLVLSGVSFCLTVLNLLPASGLDGGMILYALLSGLKNEMLADRVLCISTCLTSFVLMAAGIYILIATGSNFTFLLAGAWILFAFIRASCRPKPG